jgi:hypothetical protein
MIAEDVNVLRARLEWMREHGQGDTTDARALEAQLDGLLPSTDPAGGAPAPAHGKLLRYSEYLITPFSRWYHSDTRSTYIAVGIGRCSTNGPEENKTRYAMYWSDTKAEYKVRKLEEFLDGRFVPLGSNGLPLPVCDDGTGILWSIAPPKEDNTGGGQH